jgi:hypothetical protein
MTEILGDAADFRILVCIPPMISPSCQGLQN